MKNEKSKHNNDKKCHYCKVRFSLHKKCKRCHVLLHSKKLKFICEKCNKEHTLESTGDTDYCKDCYLYHI